MKRKGKSSWTKPPKCAFQPLNFKASNPLFFLHHCHWLNTCTGPTNLRLSIFRSAITPLLALTTPQQKKHQKKTDVLLMVQKSCRVEVVLLSGGCFFFFAGRFWSRNHSREEVWPLWKTNMTMKDTTIWRCTSYQKLWCSILMLVFRVVVVWRFFWKNQTEKNTRTKKNTSVSTHPCNFNPTFTNEINDKDDWLMGQWKRVSWIKSQSDWIFRCEKKTTDLKPLTDFRLPPQPLRISGHDNEEGFFRGKNSTKISCFDIFISTITVSRSVLGSWIAIPERDLAKHEDFIAGLSSPAPC